MASGSEGSLALGPAASATWGNVLKNKSPQDTAVCHHLHGGNFDGPLELEDHCLSLGLTKQGPLEADACGPTAFLMTSTFRAESSLP